MNLTCPACPYGQHVFCTICTICGFCPFYTFCSRRLLHAGIGCANGSKPALQGANSGADLVGSWSRRAKPWDGRDHPVSSGAMGQSWPGRKAGGGAQIALRIAVRRRMADLGHWRRPPTRRQGSDFHRKNRVLPKPFVEKMQKRLAGRPSIAAKPNSVCAPLRRLRRSACDSMLRT